MRLNGYKIFAGLAFAAMLAAVFAPAAGAQGFPARAVRYIMPLPAGSETDVFARTLPRQLGDNWNQQVVVENRPGGGTTIGSDIVAKAPADGYTLQSGKLRVIAGTNPKRAPSLPEVPTISETLPTYRAGAGIWSIVTRAGTPPAVLGKLNADIVKALQTPDVRARLAQADIEIVGSRPDSCDAYLREQTAVWGAIVKASGARVD